MTNISYSERDSYKRDVLTIIVATYNSAKTIEACLQSIIDQSSSNYQLLVVDGDSTDETVNLINKFGDCIDVFLSEKDEGVYEAWNKMLPHSRGEWVVFLGSDDAFSDERAVETILQKARGKSAEYDFMYLKLSVLESLLNPTKIIEVMGDSQPSEYLSILRKEMKFPHTGMLHRAQLFNEIGDFSTKYKISSDYEFVLRAYMSNKCKIGKIDKMLVYMSAGGLSTSIKTRLIGCKECIAIRRLHGVGWLSLFLRVRILKIYLGKAVKSLFGEKVLIVLANLYRRIVGKTPRGVYK